jgi:NTE family protein
MGKSVSLVLSSGGARGYAHIGVIEALHEAGFEIRAIVGSSMGALIGGLYANGTLPEYKDWILKLDFLGVLRLVDFTFSEAGFIKGDRVFDRMAYLFDNVAIEDLPISYTAVATDLINRKEVWFQNGSLKQAIRASIAIPMVFTPVILNGRILLDGGILNPLPVAPTVSQQTDLVVAVNVNALQSHNYPQALPETEKNKQEEFRNGLTRFLHGVGWVGSRKGQTPPMMGRFELMSRTLDTVQESLSNYKVAGYRPDVMIDIPADACNFYDFHKAYDLIELGRTVASKVFKDMDKRRSRGF